MYLCQTLGTLPLSYIVLLQAPYRTVSHHRHFEVLAHKSQVTTLLGLQPEPLEKKSLALGPTQNWLSCGYPVNDLDQYNQIWNVTCLTQRYSPSFAPFY